MSLHTGRLHGHPHDVGVVAHAIHILHWLLAVLRRLATVVAAENQIVSENADDDNRKEEALIILA